jgi:hypothetical protein
MFGDSAAWKMPLDWAPAVAKFTKDSLLKYGYVPYWVVEMKQKLTQAFRSGNKDSILFYAADLGHYIGDAHVPLHTTVNYDGQLTNQKGLHALWESVVPEILIDQYELSSSHKAQYLPHPEIAIWNAVRHSYQLTTDVFAMEKKASESFTDATKYRIQIRNGKEVKYYTADFAKAYAKLLGNTINEQLKSSADLIADFWYTAWVDAGKPDLSALVTKPFSKKAFKREVRDFRHNELLQKKLLIAKQEENSNSRQN